MAAKLTKTLKSPHTVSLHSVLTGRVTSGGGGLSYNSNSSQHIHIASQGSVQLGDKNKIISHCAPHTA